MFSAAVRPLSNFATHFQMSPDPDSSWNASIVKDSGQSKNSPRPTRNERAPGRKSRQLPYAKDSAQILSLSLFGFILCRGQRACASLKVRGQPAGVCLLHCLNSRDQTQVVKLGCKYLYPPSHRKSPFSVLFYFDIGLAWN